MQVDQHTGLDVEGLLRDRGNEIYDLHRRHINPQFVKVLQTIKFDRDFRSGRGAYLYDAEGNEYLDLISGYGTFNIGRNHPHLKATLDNVARLDLPNLVKMDVPRLAGLLAEKLVDLAPEGLDRVFFANSGAETVESAIKFARAATGKPGILYADHAFHGLSMGALSLNGSEQFRGPFGPLLADARPIPFDDLPALEAALKRKDVCAFVVEPIQGKGVYVPAEDYFREAKRLCEKYGALLVMDEVQTGFGRTGTFFACEQWGVSPHILTVAKALSGGMIPSGAVLCTDAVHKKTFNRMDRCVVHGSTFYMSDLAMAAGLATLEVMEAEDTVGNARRMGALLKDGLESLKTRHSIIREVRGRGLMLAVEFGAPSGFFNKLGRKLSQAVETGLFTQAVVMTLLDEHHILSQTAGHKVDILKFLPTLTINEADVQRIVEALDKTLASASVTGAMLSMGKNLGKQVFRGRK
ncbi:MAG: aspartate aminotransferase family protein [Planctomycetes bacterium]|nr:aspartate aminotransferase family protein [Planctomycetota bacterium]